MEGVGVRSAQDIVRALSELMGLVVCRLVQRVELRVGVGVEVSGVEVELLLRCERWREVGRLEVGGRRHAGRRSERRRPSGRADRRDRTQTARVTGHALLKHKRKCNVSKTDLFRSGATLIYLESQLLVGKSFRPDWANCLKHLSKCTRFLISLVQQFLN